jgi:PKHD-type hydroxylase
MFYVFPRAVKKSECKKLLKYCIKNTKFEEAGVINKGHYDTQSDDMPPEMLDDRSRNDPEIRKTDVGFITDKDNKVNEIAWWYLREANKIQFKYDLKYFQPVQFARYRDGGHYDWHQDAGGINPNGESRKLSLTFCLTDPNVYEGGELQFYGGSRPMEDMELPDGTKISAEQIKQDIRDQGSVIVFDSRDFHRVTPCTKGTRYSIVCWTVGPNFK